MTDPTGGDSRPDEQKTPPLPPTFPSTQPEAPQPPAAPPYGQQQPPAGSPYGQQPSATPPPPPGPGASPYGQPQQPPAPPQQSNPYGPPPTGPQSPAGQQPQPPQNPYGQPPVSGATPPAYQPGGYNGGQTPPPNGPGYPGGGGPGYPGGPGQPPPSGDFPGKTLGIVGLIVAIFFNVIGLIISIIARNQSKAAGYKNGPATAGIVVGAVLAGVGLIIAAITIVISLVTAATVGTAISSGLDNLPTSSAVSPTDGGDVDETQVDVFSIQVGDCLNDESSGTEVSDVPLVNCTDPHDYEVYYDFEIPGGSTYPGDDAISEAAEDGCGTAFETFVGVPYSSSTLDYNYYTPTSTSWEDADDRLVSCVIEDPAGKVSGTLEGSKR